MRVFVSSVMQGFSEERAVAKAAIEALDMTPVMAESFGARSSSPQAACLAGVQESDCYLGLFARRLGKPATTGKSPTEEEFEEAERLGRPMLLVVEDCSVTERDRELVDFLSRVGDYATGYFQGRYKTVAQLGPVVTRALNTLAQTRRGGGHPQNFAEVLSHFLGSKGRTFSGVTSVLVACPADSCTPLDLRRLGSDAFKTEASQIARYGSRTFEEGYGVREEEHDDSLDLIQAGQRDSHENRIRLCRDRSVVVACAVRPPPQEDDGEIQFSRLETIIDESMLADGLGRSCAFLSRAHDKLFPKPAPGRLLLQAALLNTGGQRLGKADPAQRSRSHTWREMPSPLLVPKEPLLVTQKQVGDQQDLVAQLLEGFKRAFRVAER